jgi:salicylate hydroxylase
MSLASRLHRIAVVGCGSSGLAVAAFLHQAGHEVTLFERFTTPQPLGAGLLLQPTGLAVLARLGLDRAICERGAPIRNLYGQTHKGTVIFDLSYRLLHPDLFGLGVHRASLFDVLYQNVVRLGIPIHSGHTMITTRLHADKTRSLSNDAGEDFGPFDLVIDASGRHSKLCESAADVRKDTPYPYGALWGVCRDPGQAFARDYLLQRYEAARVMIGTLAIGKKPGGTDDHVAFFWSLRTRDYQDWQAQGLEAWKDRVIRYWPEMAPFVAQLERPEDLTFAEYGDKSLHRWARDGLVFIGDAGHAMSPQLGQGANLGLIDAWTLAQTIGSHTDLPEALDAYNRARLGHLRFYQTASQWLTPFFQSDSTLAAMVRDLLFGPMCKMPYLRSEMVRTLAGMKTGLFSQLEPADWHPRHQTNSRIETS